MRTSRPNVVLGIQAFHGDSAAALVVDGTLIAAAEEERFTRVKHTAAFPKNAVAYCLEHAGMGAGDVGVLALPGGSWSNIFAKVAYSLAHPGAIRRRLTRREQAGVATLIGEIRQCGLHPAKIERHEHHLAHMASVRPLGGEAPMLLLTLDGLGDFTAAAWGVATGFAPTIRRRIKFPNSLGFFYTALTQHLGFRRFGEEFKVMGLSSYGKPRYADKLRKLIVKGDDFSFVLDHKVFPIAARGVPFSVVNGQPSVGLIHDADLLTRILDLPLRKEGEPLDERHSDGAASVQLVFEEVADHLLAYAIKKEPTIKTLGLAGGCSHNSVWVGKIADRHAIDRVIVAPACHDAGLAVGAAVLSSRREITCSEPHWALLGPSYSAPHQVGVEMKSDEELQTFMARELAQGKIVGLFRGRLEFGPRALGNRSILCDPRPSAMRDRLNARVKHREGFRPFAAIVMRERQDEWFVKPFYSPTMESVFQVQTEKRSRIAAVTHADGSCRIQSVDRSVQPFIWGLLLAFEKETSVPLLVNTSFNDSEPIVCTPEDALRCFERTEIDFLVIDRTIVSRSDLT